MVDTHSPLVDDDCVWANVVAGVTGISVVDDGLSEISASVVVGTVALTVVVTVAVTVAGAVTMTVIAVVMDVVTVVRGVGHVVINVSTSPLNSMRHASTYPHGSTGLSFMITLLSAIYLNLSIGGSDCIRVL